MFCQVGGNAVSTGRVSVRSFKMTGNAAGTRGVVGGKERDVTMMLEEMFGHKPRHNACDWLMGMSVGVAVGMMGALLVQSSGGGKVKRTAHKMAKDAEHAVAQLDKMVTDFTEHKK
jgi:hypothetical protein